MVVVGDRVSGLASDTMPRPLFSFTFPFFGFAYCSVSTAFGHGRIFQIQNWSMHGFLPDFNYPTPRSLYVTDALMRMDQTLSGITGLHSKSFIGAMFDAYLHSCVLVKKISLL